MERREEALQIAHSVRRLNKEIADIFSNGKRSKRGATVDQGNGASSRHFMIDLLPRIKQFLAQQERGRSLTVLDVGCGSGSGADLLASLYPNKAFCNPLKVTGLDIIDDFAAYVIGTTRYIDFVRADLFKMRDIFDIVVCSHVIEHVREPEAFCAQLQRVCRGRVFLATPFDEPVEGRTKAHCNSFGFGFVQQVNPRSWAVVQSEAWGSGRKPHYGMLVMELDGLATEP